MTEIHAWSANQDRTAIAVQEPDRRIACWSLSESGQVTAPLANGRSVGWELLGWAGPSLLALWRRQDQGSELKIVNVGDSAVEPLRHKVLGRPIHCGIGSTGELEVLVAISDGEQTMLGLHRPKADSYLMVDGAEGFNRIAAWDASQGFLAVSLVTGLRLYRYEEAAFVDLGIDFPGSARPLDATERRAGLIGLTGRDQAGRPIPGLLDLTVGTVTWFRDHAGYSCAEISPSGERVLAVGWADEQHAYRVLDTCGHLAAEPTRPPGLTTGLTFSRDGLHLIGRHESPVQPPEFVTWNWQEVAARPLCPTWEHFWTKQRIPEWVFQPDARTHGGTVLFLHGGPGGQLRQGYDPVIAALLGAGWRVVGMNYPGSSGYGAEFEAVSRGDWGGADAAAIEYRLRSLREESAGPVCLYGQSYGAYLALLVDGRLADRIAVWAPVTDLPLLLASADGVQRRWLERQLAAMRFDPSLMRRRSPVDRVAVLARLPLLIGHGRLDDRCPVAQSRLLVRRLPEVRYLEDPAAGHSPSDWQWWTEAVVAHFEGVMSCAG
ncbi:alpha/beta hydrolase family protein [Nonomuraea sp. NPDC059007]|uniref:alpha/beta hydrolase family protein n=1 Tax=Nonomuraea sp. NPDC059007 TaxID=3346692 RepID=UPI00367B6086